MDKNVILYMVVDHWCIFPYWGIILCVLRWSFYLGGKFVSLLEVMGS